MKTIRHIQSVTLAALTAFLLLLPACEPVGPDYEIPFGLSFRVTGIEEGLTKSPGSPSREVYLSGLSGDIVTAAGDTLRMRVGEMPLSDALRGGTPATKATPEEGMVFPTDWSFGLLACSYEDQGSIARSPKKVWTDPSVVRTDYDGGTGARKNASEKWVPSRRQLWPREGYVRFFAYAPFTDADGDGVDDLTIANTLSLTSTSGGPKLSFGVPQVEDQIDLMVTDRASSKEYQADPEMPGIDVPLTFRHILTGIRFRVGNEITAIKSIRVENVRNEGEFEFATGEWNGSSLKGNAGYTITNPGLEGDPSDPSYKITKLENTLLLLPQELPDGAKIIATVVVRIGGEEREHTVEAEINGQVWDPGTLVIYTITDSEVAWVFEVLDAATHKPFEGISQTLDESLSSDPLNRIRNLAVRSYKSINIGGLNKDVYEEAAWEVAYSVDGGVTWKDDWGSSTLWSILKDGDDVSGGGTGVKPTQSDPDPSELRKLEIKINDWADKATVYEKITPHGFDLIGELRKPENRDKGTEAQPFDLSMHNIYGQENAAYSSGGQDVPGINAPGAHTSNCYVVSAPGWYCFPLVFGNALDATRAASGDNSVAYSAQDGATGFYDASGNQIADPYIIGTSPNLDDYEAVVVWQDVDTGFEVVSECGLFSHGGMPYMRFKIERGDPNKVTQDNHPGYLKGGILPCNIVLALRDKNNQDFKNGKDGDMANSILWSWHIWVTPTPHAELKDDFAIRKLNYTNTEGATEQTSQLDLLNCILGWTPPMYFYGGVRALTREVLLRFRQPGSGKEIFVKIHQTGEKAKESDGGIYYNGTFYQWGRKDPFLSGNIVGSTHNRYWVSSEYNIVKDKDDGKLLAADPTGNSTGSLGGEFVGQEIRYPYIFASYYYSMYKNITLAGLINIQNAKSIRHWNALGDVWDPAGSSEQGYTPTPRAFNHTVKTVYDPCPPGFCVPFYNAFSLCPTAPERKVEEGYGWIFPEWDNLRFPFTGRRSNNNQGQFHATISDQVGEGMWCSSLKFVYKEEIDQDGKLVKKWIRYPYHLQMSVTRLFMNQNEITRGNVIRPIVEEVPAP